MIDPKLIRRLWREGLPIGYIARNFDISTTDVALLVGVRTAHGNTPR